MIGPVSAAQRYEDCKRKCEECKIGASNAAGEGSVTFIYQDPLENISPKVRAER
jgi:hypothetical protein